MIFPSLYLIVDPALHLTDPNEWPSVETSFFQSISNAIEGGVRLIQYRDKSAQRGKMLKIAERLREMTLKREVCLIINDEIDLAMAVKADGVHLGQDDFPLDLARRLLGKEAIIGLSTHNLLQALEAPATGADYIGFGPIFQTRTKLSQNQAVGIDAIAIITKQVSIPLYAIGGIKLSHLPKVMSAGATGVAVASALARADKAELEAWQTALASP